MTTIAYSGKDCQMACDSAWCDADQVLTRRPKIYRLPSGGLLGEAGACDTRDVVALLGHCKTPGALPSRKTLMELKLEYSAILVLPRGRIFHVFMDSPEHGLGDWDCGIYEVGEMYFAVGSGQSYALAILENGGTARRAVEVACRRDIASRTPVHTATLPNRPK